MKKYSTKLNREQLEGITQLLHEYIRNNRECASCIDKMILATLMELLNELNTRLADSFKKDFKITMRAPTALCFCSIVINMVRREFTSSYEGATAFRMANEIYQLYA